MADINDTNNNANDVVSGVEPIKKKKTGAVIAGIAAGVVGVAAVGGAAAYGFSDFVKNQVKLRISKPQNYYTWITEKNSSALASRISSNYRSALKEREKGQNTSMSLKLEISEELKNTLLNQMGTMEDNAGADVIKNISEIKIGMNTAAKGTSMNGSAYAELNGENLTTIEMASDSASLDSFFRIPELTERWIAVETALSDDSNEAIKFIDAYTNALNDPESIITPDELESLVSKYTGIWNNCINDVSLEKKSEITINDITVNYTVASVELNRQKAEEIAVEFINAAKEDELLKSIMVDKTAVMTAEEYASALDDAIDDLKHESDFEYSDITLTLDTYIDAAGNIRGMGFDTSDSSSSFLMIVGKDGSEIRGEVYAKDNEEEAFRADLTMTENSGKYNGNLDFKADDETISVEFTDFETVNEEKGYINGLFTFIIPETDPVSVTCTSDGSSQLISADVEIEGTSYGKATLEISSDSGAEPTVPDKDGAFVINSSNPDISVADYVGKEEMTRYISGILSKLGMSSEEANETAKLLSDNIYNDYDYADDFEDIDVNDFEIDEDETATEAEETDESDDPYADDMVFAMPKQAYITLADNTFTSNYMGAAGGTLSYNAQLADITGDGTYSLKVTADTDGYRNTFDGAKPMGIVFLAVEMYGYDDVESAEITIESFKVDGKEYKVTGTPSTDIKGDYISCILYVDEGLDPEDGGKKFVDLSKIEEWTTVEVTFNVKGIS